MDLASAKKDSILEVVSLSGGTGFKAKLEAMGIFEGIKLRKINQQILGGPIVISCKGTQLAVGRNMAKKIIVRYA